ncbi:ankyrin repeat protein [Acanthamoeba polyphaga moumouvirus]|uniref:Ankyrin repeat protein n=1 Tax=Acanthamoeba polyphaga moumouvirus TaxID=1269028 RepID=L7RC19_9VIRU|nr:ankyrin repeat protein [Acanthamoeba polyphaga moumouvirus]AGC01741.1 ankyrin repeat protein [Acanthamoeba polyphaga moumouvirus]
MVTPSQNFLNDKILNIDILINLNELNNSELDKFISDKLNVMTALYFYCKLDMFDNLSYILNIIANHTQLYQYVKNSKEINEFLCLACDNNYYNIVKILLEFGADCNYLDGKSLLIAIQNNNINIVELLLKHGIDVNNINNKILETCCINNNFEIFDLFIKNGIYLSNSYQDLLNLCLKYKSADCGKLLIKYGNDNIDFHTSNNSKVFDEEDFLYFSDN